MTISQSNALHLKDVFMLLNEQSPETEGRSIQVNYRRQTSEMPIWIIISATIACYLFFSTYFEELRDMHVYPESARKLAGNEIVYILYKSLLPSFLVYFVPILFKQIFGLHPFEWIRIYSQYSSIRKSAVNSKNRVTGEAPPPSTDAPQSIDHQLEESIIGSDKVGQSENYQLTYIEESRLISNRIFTRAGAYLMAGCVIAFIGLGYLNFSLIGNQASSSRDNYEPINLVDKPNSNARDSLTKPNINPAKSDIKANQGALTEVEERLLNYLPRFGTLLLIEFIAFFFLKQYRITSEEYRYYEAIKRKRQDNFVLLNIIKDNKDSPEVTKLLQELFVENLSSHKLSKDETTQVLETQKILNQEMDFFGKLTDLVKAVKSK
jgi:hypothetical protein